MNEKSFFPHVFLFLITAQLASTNILNCTLITTTKKDHCNHSNSLAEINSIIKISSVIGSGFESALERLSTKEFSSSYHDVKFIPENFAEFFPNLEIISITHAGLKEIKQNDFKQFFKLSFLDLSSNEIKIIEANLFRFNGELREIFLEENPIFSIHPSAFCGLNKIEKLKMGRVNFDWTSESENQIFEDGSEVFGNLLDVKEFSWILLISSLILNILFIFGGIINCCIGKRSKNLTEMCQKCEQIILLEAGKIQEFPKRFSSLENTQNYENFQQFEENQNNSQESLAGHARKNSRKKINSSKEPETCSNNIKLHGSRNFDMLEQNSTNNLQNAVFSNGDSRDFENSATSENSQESKSFKFAPKDLPNKIGKSRNFNLLLKPHDPSQNIDNSSAQNLGNLSQNLNKNYSESKTIEKLDDPSSEVELDFRLQEVYDEPFDEVRTSNLYQEVDYSSCARKNVNKETSGDNLKDEYSPVYVESDQKMFKSDKSEGKNGEESNYENIYDECVLNNGEKPIYAECKPKSSRITKVEPKNGENGFNLNQMDQKSKKNYPGSSEMPSNSSQTSKFSQNSKNISNHHQNSSENQKSLKFSNVHQNLQKSFQISEKSPEVVPSILKIPLNAQKSPGNFPVTPKTPSTPQFFTPNSSPNPKNNFFKYPPKIPSNSSLKNSRSVSNTNDEYSSPADCLRSETSDYSSTDNENEVYAEPEHAIHIYDEVIDENLYVNSITMERRAFGGTEKVSEL